MRIDGTGCDFAFLFLVVLLSLLTKGFIMGLSFFTDLYNRRKHGSPIWIILKVTLLFLPNLLMASTCLVVKVGPRRALSVILRYPGTILMPVFSAFTFSTSPNMSKCCCYYCYCCNVQDTHLQLSLKSTATNAVLTFVCEVLVHALGSSFSDLFGGLPLRREQFFLVWMEPSLTLMHE